VLFRKHTSEGSHLKKTRRHKPASMKYDKCENESAKVITYNSALAAMESLGY